MEDLLLDACVALNLIASGVSLDELAGASCVRFIMTSVAASETLWLEPVDPLGVRELIDDSVLADRGVSLVTLTEIETVSFVELARSIDDGEAATIAVAIHRRLGVATDDRKAVRLAESQSSSIEVVRTSQLMRRWADNSNAIQIQVREAIRTIQRRANYVPPRDDPHLDWWLSVYEEQGR
jgi:predicted nucleic acid-binding protein